MGKWGLHLDQRLRLCEWYEGSKRHDRSLEGFREETKAQLPVGANWANNKGRVMNSNLPSAEVFAKQISSLSWTSVKTHGRILNLLARFAGQTGVLDVGEVLLLKDRLSHEMAVRRGIVLQSSPMPTFQYPCRKGKGQSD